MAISQKVSVTTDRKTIAPVVYAVQGDTGRQIVAEYSDFQLAAGMTGVFAFTRSDGTSYSVPATIDVTANTATAEMDQALTQTGKTKGQIKITDSSGLGSTFTFYIDVQEDLSGTPTEQQYYDIQAAVEAAAEAKAEADQVLEDLGPISQINDRLTEAEEELDNKADIDGTYPSLTAGLSEQLLSSNRVTDQTPYLYRQTALGKANATRALMRKIVGGSVIWNQLFATSSGTIDFAGITYVRGSDGTITASGTATAESYLNVGSKLTTLLNHKVYIGGCPSGGSETTYALRDGYTAGDAYKDFGNGAIIKGKANFIIQLMVSNGVDLSTPIIFIPQAIDLTAMFGTTIADYVYSLEQATAGSGIAKLREWGFFGEDYYSYDAGTMRSVEGVSAKITRDADANVIGNYPLDSSLTLRGILKLDSDNNLYYDGDEYAADGTVVRKYGVVDLGTLTWQTRTTGSVNKLLSSSVPKQYCGVSANAIKALSTPYPYIGASSAASLQSCIDTAAVGVYSFNNSGTTATIYTVVPVSENPSGSFLYEVATPTTETAEPYTEVQVVDKDGTEQFVTTGIVPVGHVTEYPEDLVGKLDSIPNLPTAAGRYVLQVTVASGKVTYAWAAE